MDYKKIFLALLLIIAIPGQTYSRFMVRSRQTLAQAVAPVSAQMKLTQKACDATELNCTKPHIKNDLTTVAIIAVCAGLIRLAINKCLIDNDLAIFEAINKDDLPTIQNIVTKNPSRLEKILIGNAKTPLIHAAAQNKLEIVLFLLEKGANVNAKDCYGQTALMFAAKHNNEKMLVELLNRNANVLNTVKKRDGTIMKAVDFTTDPKIKEILLSKEKSLAQTPQASSETSPIKEMPSKLAVSF